MASTPLSTPWRARLETRLLLFVMLGLRDGIEGIYLFRRALLEEISLVSTRSAGIVAFELAAKVRRLGRPIAHTKIDCLPRRSGRSKVADARNIGPAGEASAAGKSPSVGSA